MRIHRSPVLACLAVAWLFFGGTVHAQYRIDTNGTHLETLQSQFRVDFAIPDIPAFSLLGASPSKVLRPTNVRELSVAVSDFLGGASGVNIPKDFAMEFSPGLLLDGPTLTLTEYQKCAWWYRTRISAATIRGNSAATALALGIRTTLYDASDVRTDDSKMASVTEITEKITAVYASARQRAGAPPAAIVLNAEDQAAVRDLNKRIKETWADKRWNATLVDVALAVSASAQDSTGADARFQAASAWLSASYGFGSWAQALGGFSLQTVRNPNTGGMMTEWSASCRVYVGSNRYKAFIEAQASTARDTLQGLIHGGAECNLFSGSWVEARAGLLFIEKQPHATLNTEVKLHLSLAEILGWFPM